MSSEFELTTYQMMFRAAAEAAGFTPSELAPLDGEPLVAWELPGDGPRVYLSAGIHGDEPAGSLALLELLRGGFFTPSYHWLICPALNPTGLAAGSRENAAGLDLNRDYFLRETREIAAHAAWLDARPRPDLFMSLHEDWEATGFYFYEINLAGDDPGRAQQILAAVKPWFAPEAGPEIDGHEARAAGWIYHAAEPDLPEGWPEAIYLAKIGCPVSFTFETPSHAPLAQRVAAHAAAVRVVCAGLAKA